MSYAPPQSPYLDILHVEETFIIVNKQAGLLTVPGRGDDKKDCLISRLQSKFEDALVVHRLDMQTSGLVIFPRSKEIQIYFGHLFEEKKVQKTYHAIVDGIPEQSSGIIDYPLAPDWPNRPKQKVDFLNGKKSQTLWTALKSNKTQTLIELCPKTGRTHQLRVHMAEFGHPIIGDMLYAKDKDLKDTARLLLHASKLEFNHPLNKQKIVFNSTPTFTQNI